MSIRYLISALLLFLMVTRVGPADASRPDTVRNIVIFIADDHGRDTGAYGNPVIRTPNLDALAEEGTLFTHAFATTASCSASRSVILSGLHNHRNGQYGHTHDFHHFQTFEHVKSLPVLLAEAGYRTASAGKYHVAPESVFHFEEYIDGDSRDVVTMVDNARPFLERDAEEPFFFYLGTSDPHRGGGLMAGDTEATYGDDEAFAPNRFGNRPGGYPGIEEVQYDPDDVIVPPFLPDTPVTRAELAQYYQSVSRIDQGFGYLVDVLKDAGVYENTLIIYMSDHGIAMPGAKTTVYEPGLRSPLIVRHPDQSDRGVVTDAMVSWVDITPTLLDYAGVEEPTYDQHVGLEDVRRHLPDRHGLHGRSFLSVLEGEEAEGRDAIYASHTFHEIQMYYPMRVVRDRDYKLIWNVAHDLPYPFAADLWDASTWQHAYQQGLDTPFGGRTVREYMHRPAFELFDVRVDPLESENLAYRPGYADVLAAYQAMLWQFEVRTSDPWLLKWEYE
ncbi:MAG: sulfatase [Rhodothermales bacterium]